MIKEPSNMTVDGKKILLNMHKGEIASIYVGDYNSFETHKLERAFKRLKRVTNVQYVTEYAYFYRERNAEVKVITEGTDDNTTKIRIEQSRERIELAIGIATWLIDAKRTQDIGVFADCAMIEIPFTLVGTGMIGREAELTLNLNHYEKGSDKLFSFMDINGNRQRFESLTQLKMFILDNSKWM